MAAPDSLNLRVVMQSDSVLQADTEVVFRVKPSTELAKLKKSFGERIGFAMENLWFLFKSQVIKDCDTPSSLRMTDRDFITAVRIRDRAPWEPVDMAVEETAELGGSAGDTPDAAPEVELREHWGGDLQAELEEEAGSVGRALKVLEERHARELAEIQMEKAKETTKFACKKIKYLEAKRKWLLEEEEFEREEAAQRKLGEKFAKEEELLRKKQKAIVGQTLKARQELRRLEGLARGETARRSELECPVCMEEMVPPTQIYGVSNKLAPFRYWVIHKLFSTEVSISLIFRSLFVLV